jgi:hypothetical protein
MTEEQLLSQAWGLSGSDLELVDQESVSRMMTGNADGRR